MNLRVETPSCKIILGSHVSIFGIGLPKIYMAFIFLRQQYTNVTVNHPYLVFNKYDLIYEYKLKGLVNQCFQDNYK